MRLEPPPSTAQIDSESDFYQYVKKKTLGVIGYERLEPSNESGCPDANFVIKSPRSKNREGTIEFKWLAQRGAPDLSGPLLRGSQKAALIEYGKMGGSRRFVLVYAGGEVWLYNTADALHSVVRRENKATALAQLEEPGFVHWLLSCLEV